VYEKEIKEAKKIGDGWLKTTQSARANLVSLKKDNLALEKGALRRVQAAIQNGAHNDPAERKKLENELDVIEDRLKDYLRMGKKIFDDHDKWALGDPRSNMGFIGPKLKLGPATGPAYKAVSTACKRMLTDVATGIAATQAAWKDDLQFSLKTHMDAVTAARKILDKDSGVRQAFLQQISGEVDRFIKYCDSAFTNLKVTADARDLSDIKGGVMAQKDKMVQDQKLQQYEKKLTLIPEIQAQLNKNYQRVIKSVPAPQMNSWLASAKKKAMEDHKKVTDDKLKAATKLYTTLIPEMKKLGASSH
jgi:hypothetical protein